MMVINASKPRLLMLPAFTDFDRKPDAGDTVTLKIWFDVVLLYRLASSVMRLLKNPSSTPPSSERVISGLRSALARAFARPNCGSPRYLFGSPIYVVASE